MNVDIKNQDATARWKTLAANGGVFVERISGKLIDPRMLLKQANAAQGILGALWDEEYIPASRDLPLVDSSTRESVHIRHLNECMHFKVGNWVSSDGLWRFTLAVVQEDVSKHFARLILSVVLDVPPVPSHCPAFVGTIATCLEDNAFPTSRCLMIPSLELGCSAYMPPKLIQLNEVHYAAVIEFHFGHYIHHLEHLCSQAVPHFDIHFDIQGQISMARRQNLKALGIGLQTHPDLVAQIVEVGKLSLRDVERLSATCKTMRTSLPRETEHRLRSVLSKYFPDALIELAYTLRDHDALVSGSAMLHVLAPGHWEPGDLDIVLPESSCTTFEAFLTLHGYVFDASRQAALLRLYPQTAAPAAFRYRCFLKGERKIDLCYIEDSFPPLSHILTYHSTAVMNFYDGSELVCLFPDQTFAHQYVRNNLAMFNRRLQASLEKLKKRGFVQNVGWMHEWFATALDEQGEHVAPAKLPTIWRQPVAL